MYRRLLRAECLELMPCMEVIVEAYGSIKTQIGNPRPVEKPCKGGVGTEVIVPGLFIFPLERIRIVLGVHSAEVACEPRLETEHISECIAVRERDAAAGI